MSAESTAGKDPLISGGGPVATEIRSGDHPKVEPRPAPVAGKNAGFDHQPGPDGGLDKVDPRA